MDINKVQYLHTKGTEVHAHSITFRTHFIMVRVAEDAEFILGTLDVRWDGMGHVSITRHP